MSEVATIRAKMRVTGVTRTIDAEGNISNEQVALTAVYSDKPGSANAQWSKWTPAGSLSLTISNPGAMNKLLPDQYFYIDLIPADKDSL